MKNFFKIFAFLLLTNNVFSQTKSIDSVKKIINEKKSDTSTVSAYLWLSNEYKSRDIDSSLFYSKKGVLLSKENNNFRLVNAFNNLGTAHLHLSNSDSARFYYDKALKILDKEDDKIQRSTIYANYSLSYQNSNNLDKRTEYNLKAIKLVEDNNEKVCLLYFNQGVIESHAELFDESKKNMLLAYKTSKSAQNFRVMAAALRGLAYYSIKDNELDNAEIYLIEGLELCEKLNTPEICYEINSQLGELYDGLEKYEEAKKSYLKAKDYAITLKNNFQIMSIYTLLARHELNRNNYDQSAFYFQEFENLYKINPEPQLGVATYDYWAELEKKRKNYLKSNTLLTKYVSLKDSIFSEQNREMLANAEVKYETEKKDKEIATQKLQLQEQENDILKKKNQFYLATGSGGLVFLGSLGLWLFYRQRQKLKNIEIEKLHQVNEITKLEAMIEGEEKERNRLAQDLHDGINGDLSAIKHQLSSITSEKLEDDDQKTFNKAIDMIDNSCQQVRRISHNLSPLTIKDFGLVASIEQYCSKLKSLHPIAINFQHFGEEISLPESIETNIYRIIQELLNNIVKHSKATEALAQINNHKENLFITVEDNGKGFNKEDENNGIGLKNIASRVQLLNGQLDIDHHEQGTTFTINIDLLKIPHNV